MAAKAFIKEVFPLARGPFKTFDPFLFCVYHRDEYPAGEENMGPHPKYLKSRDLGMDFSYEDGWSMYHGAEVPGFPAHPHRGFETVTVTRQGLIDHADSLGTTARYGNGDTQWMTAGRGVQHSEMFPLIHRDKPNTADLFQIWLNLPRVDKMCEPGFAMFWAENTPKVALPDPVSGQQASVTVIAGALETAVPLAPPPHSWAADESHDVAIWIVTVPKGCSVTLPPARNPTSNRAFYFVQGRRLSVSDGSASSPDAGRIINNRQGVVVDATQPLTVRALDDECHFILLQGAPIKEPVVQRGPMVMNTEAEIQQAFADYQRTHYGGWPWKEHDHVHPRTTGRHAFHDGRMEYPPGGAPKSS